MMTFLSHLPMRVQCAILTGLAGGATAQTMTLWGGDLAHFLPPILMLTLAGCFGAAVSGAVWADVFGRRGWRGAAIAFCAWPFVTGLGAAVASVPFALSEMDLHRSVIATLGSAIEVAAPLGWMAVGNGIATSPQVAAIWLLSAAMVHFGVRSERLRFT